MEINCKYCGSENVYFSKKKQLYVCEDCERTFSIEKEITPRKVFLSYGHDQNREIIEIIYDRLKERGHEPWIDKENIKAGDDWRNAISEGILNSNGFLAFISNYSVRVPGVCLDEISIGVSNYNCRIQSVLLEKGVSVPNSISNIQWLDMSDWKEVKETKDELIWKKWLNEKIDKIISIVENPENLEISGNISYLDKTLMPLSPSLKMRQILKNEIVLRDWLTDAVKKYLDNSQSEALIVFGSPGTGKSVLSAYLSNFSTACIAAYFCEFNNSQTLSTGNLVNSIIFQLACSLEDYQKRLMEIVYGKSVANLTWEERLDSLLLQPLSQLIDGGRDNCIIVIDAIDEALEKNKEICDAITRIIEGLPHWIRVVITARPEKELIGRFQMYDRINIDDHADEVANDIKKYVLQGVHDADAAQKIISRSQNSFLYANELLKLYRENKSDFDLEAIPHGLSGIYYVNFRRQFGDRNTYESIYKPLFEVLFAAKEQLTVSEVSSLLDISEEDLKKQLWNANSYVNVLIRDNEKIIQIIHKSILEWLTSDSACEYTINVQKGDAYFEKHLLQAIEDNYELTEYYAKYSIQHISNRHWEEMDIGLQESVLEKLIDLAQKYGFLDLEKNYLSELEKCVGKTQKYYWYALEHYKKVSGEKVLSIAKEAMQFIKEEVPEESKQFDLIAQIAFAFFYSGNAKEGFRIIKEERSKHRKEFWENETNNAKYWHAVSVCAHDLDANNSVILAAQNDVEMCKKKKQHYDRYIAMINLFDGYMATGQLDIAEKTAKEVFSAIEERYYIHVDDILRLCYANLLQTEGRIMESLVYYEEGLKLAKGIQTWDYLYGSVWRELAISKFGDPSCIMALNKYKVMAQEKGYEYIVSLADCFQILASYYIGEPIKKDILEEVISLGMPGHILQSTACIMLQTGKDSEIDLFMKALSECEGIKGSPDIISEFLNKMLQSLSEEDRISIEAWCSKYVQPVIDYQKKVVQENTGNLEDKPRLKSYNCMNCQAKCCYDGVYITPKEESNIKAFIAEYPEFFTEMGDVDFFVNGDWPGMRSERKTEKIPYNKYDETFPAHFTKTRCIFALKSGECVLQRASTDLQMHPWKIKPRACWSFPIRGVEGDLIIPPETDQLNDSDYVDESYPGYATFLPCTDEDDVNGQVWYDKYRFEVEYYRYLMKNKML